MNKKNPLLITNVNIYAENELVENGSILIHGHKIIRILSSPVELQNIKDKLNCTIIDGEGLNAIPGFIDGHIHGANGADIMDATAESLDNIAQILPSEGTTSFLATTTSESVEKINGALRNIARYSKNKAGQAEIIGIHLEGPFIESKKAGAHVIDYVISPDLQQYKGWEEISGKLIKTVTMAPELDGKGVFIEYLVNNGVNVSSGHTLAGINDMKKAVQRGVNQVTHICNAMNFMQHRDVGVIGAAFLYYQLRAELIADGIHVSPEMIEILYRNIGSDRLMLITDSMRAKYLETGTYNVRGQEVTVTEDRAILSNGSLAGSVLKMVQGAKNMKEITGASMRDVIKMTAINAAKQMNIYDRKGSIKAEKDADILLVDDQLNIYYTFCRGKIAFKRVLAE